MLSVNRVVRIPPPVSGGLILSYKCTATCRHCMYFCSPDWQADWISSSDLEFCLTQLARTIRPASGGPASVGLNEGLHFTGGEPFMNFALLEQAVAMTAEMGIPSLFVETNAVWCRDDRTTKDKLNLLRDRGLKGIMISVNPYYTEFVPFERTERCARISLEIFGRNVMIYQLEFFRLFLKSGLKGCLSFSEFQRTYAGDVNPWYIELFLMGRAVFTLRECYPRRSAAAYFSGSCQPPFLRPWHNHFDNYGQFMPGFCGGLSLGDWHQLDALVKEGVDLSQRPILSFLIQEDLAGLVGFAREQGFQERDSGYVSRCDLCLDVRRFLFRKGGYPELAPAEYYRSIDREFGET